MTRSWIVLPDFDSDNGGWTVAQYRTCRGSGIRERVVARLPAWAEATACGRAMRSASTVEKERVLRGVGR